MSVLADIQTTVEQRLQDATLFDGLDYFGDVTIIKEDIGDIVNQIQRALGPVAGICIVILTVDADNEHPNVNPPYLSNINVAVQVIENVVINRAQDSYKTANDMIEHVLLYLNHHVPSGAGECLILDREAIRTDDNPPPPANLSKRAIFKTSAGITLST